jgi:cytidine deaminase
MNDADRELFARAEAVAARAYAPYSDFFVGAAARAVDGHVIDGVNVENASYSLGVCAERSALTTAVTEGYRPGDIEALAVTASPCGGCRQWLVEFGIARIVYRNSDGDVVARTPAELLPDTFEL